MAYDAENDVVYAASVGAKLAPSATALDVYVPGANGLAYSAADRVLYAVSFGGKQGGSLWTIELREDGTVSDASSRTIIEKRRFDGIALRPDDKLLISDWGVKGTAEAGPALHQVTEGGYRDGDDDSASGVAGPGRLFLRRGTRLLDPGPTRERRGSSATGGADAVRNHSACQPVTRPPSCQTSSGSHSGG